MFSISLQSPPAVSTEVTHMVSISLQRSMQTLHIINFSSTLFLRPILELLLVDIPPAFRAELRLGLQEALVNAARHGNCLDPHKSVRVQFAVTPRRYLWIITDQGQGFNCQKVYTHDPTLAAGYVHQECGRGVLMLKQIFDEVVWNEQGNQLRLCKHLSEGCRPLVV